MLKHNSPSVVFARQRGASLIEALLAFLALSLGMLALARVQTGLRAGADIARERSVAVRLAQVDTERSRAFADYAGWSTIAKPWHSNCGSKH